MMTENVHQTLSVHKYKLVALLLAVFLAGGVAGWAVGHKAAAAAMQFLNSVRPIRQLSDKYAYISPLLAYESAESSEFTEYKPLESKINMLIQQSVAAQNTTQVSVYFRDLNRGRWVGINESDSYDPASLLKVPLMIAYLKEAESDSAVLNRSLTFTSQIAAGSNIPFSSPSELKIGSSYTVDDLLHAMIVDSDNGAKDLLLSAVDQNSLNATYSDLGVANPDAVSGEYTISAKTYSLFFRVLYNATYLSRDMSEKALALLSQTQFKDGLVAGLPQGLQVSHKFGEHVDTNAQGQATGTVEFHDCGIVYYTASPYILCVMTTGSDQTKLQNTIRDISQLVYAEVKNNYK